MLQPLPRRCPAPVLVVLPPLPTFLCWLSSSWVVLALGVLQADTSQVSLADDVASPLADQESQLQVLDQEPVASGPSLFEQRQLLLQPLY